MRHTLSILVENRFGELARIVGLFSAIFTVWIYVLVFEHASLFDASVKEPALPSTGPKTLNRLEQGKCVRQRGWLKKIRFQGRGLLDGIVRRGRSPRVGGNWRGASL
jgi:hypothetical protein